MEEEEAAELSLFMHLPMEVIGLVFSFLPSRGDVTRAGICCWHLYHALCAFYPHAMRVVEEIRGHLLKEGDNTALLLQADPKCSWKGKWIVDGGDAVRTLGLEFFGEFRVINIQLDKTTGVKIISIQMPLTCGLSTVTFNHVKKHIPALGDPTPQYARRQSISTTLLSVPEGLSWTAQLQLLPTGSPMEFQRFALAGATLVRAFEHTIRTEQVGRVAGEYLMNAEDPFSTLRDVESRFAGALAMTAAERDRKEKLERQKIKALEDIQRFEEAKMQREKERLELEKRRVEELARLTEEKRARPKFSYEELKRLVASKDEGLQIAHAAGEIYTHLKDEDYPLAFDGNNREEFLSLKPWTQKSLIEKAGLF